MIRGERHRNTGAAESVAGGHGESDAVEPAAPIDVAEVVREEVAEGALEGVEPAVTGRGGGGAQINQRLRPPYFAVVELSINWPEPVNGCSEGIGFLACVTMGSGRSEVIGAS